MDRRAWWTTHMGSQRLIHDLVTKQQQNTRGAEDLGTGDICYGTNSSFREIFN